MNDEQRKVLAELDALRDYTRVLGPRAARDYLEIHGRIELLRQVEPAPWLESESAPLDMESEVEAELRRIRGELIDVGLIPPPDNVLPFKGSSDRHQQTATQEAEP